LLLHRARPAELPERVALRLLDEALDALLEMLDAAGDGVLARLEGVLTDADEVVEEAARERAAAPSLLGDDLGQDLHRHVLARAVVHHLDLLAGLDERGELLHRDVAARREVVELAAAVALDRAGHGSGVRCPVMTRCGMEGFAPCRTASFFTRCTDARRAVLRLLERPALADDLLLHVAR